MIIKRRETYASYTYCLRSISNKKNPILSEIFRHQQKKRHPKSVMEEGAFYIKDTTGFRDEIKDFIFTKMLY